MDAFTPLKVIESSNAAIARTSATVALILVGIAAWVWWEAEAPMGLDVNARDFNPITLLVVVLLAIALVYLARAFLYWARLAKFRRSTLTCQPVYPGHTLRAVIRGERDLEATGPYVFTLKCIETERVGNGEEGGGRHREHERWMATTTREANTVWLSRGIPIEIPIPRGVMPSSGRVRWILEATAPVRGQDYHEVFLVDMADGPIAEDDEA